MPASESAAAAAGPERKKLRRVNSFFMRSLIDLTLFVCHSAVPLCRSATTLCHSVALPFGIHSFTFSHPWLYLLSFRSEAEESAVAFRAFTSA
jgi:hypothetical protein